MQSIDVFLSHDWETSRWMKLMVMLLVFNSPSAMASLLASLAVGVGQVSGVVPESLWFFRCYWVYLLVLCCWQRRGLAVLGLGPLCNDLTNCSSYGRSDISIVCNLSQANHG